MCSSSKPWHHQCQQWPVNLTVPCYGPLPTTYLSISARHFRLQSFCLPYPHFLWSLCYAQILVYITDRVSSRAFPTSCCLSSLASEQLDCCFLKQLLLYRQLLYYYSCNFDLKAILLFSQNNSSRSQLGQM